jgi:hypothetical protein
MSVSPPPNFYFLVRVISTINKVTKSEITY